MLMDKRTLILALILPLVAAMTPDILVKVMAKQVTELTWVHVKDLVMVITSANLMIISLQTKRILFTRLIRKLYPRSL